MFAGGSYDEVGRWLLGFLNSHAKRESPRVEGVLETGGGREGTAYGVRLRLGERSQPPLDQPAIEFGFHEVAAGKGSFAWCTSLAERVRGWARGLLDHPAGAPVSRTD